MVFQRACKWRNEASLRFCDVWDAASHGWRRCCDYGGLLGNEGSLETRSWSCTAEGWESSLCCEDVEIDGWRHLGGEEKDG